MANQDDDDLYNRKPGLMGNIRNILVGVLVGMLVLAFAVWGVEDVFSPNNSNAVVQVGDEEVGRVEFRDRFNRQMREFAQSNGSGITNQEAYDRGMPQQLVAQIQQDLAILADAKDLGVGVNNRDVRRYVENIDAFRNEITQQYDSEQLQRLLASNQIRQEDFERDVIEGLIRQQTIPAILGGVQVPADYAQRFNIFANEVRTATLMRFDEDAIDPIADPTDTQLSSYIAANQASFTDPEYRQVLMIRLEPFDFVPDSEVSDEDVQERFDTLVRIGEIGAVETRDVLIIAVPSEDQAEIAAQRISNGENPQAVANDLSLQAPDRFESVIEDGLINPASSDAAFAVGEGEARVAPTEFGTFEVVYVETINPAETPDFDTMADELRAELLEGEARRQIADRERIIDDMILEGATLEEIAEEINAPLSAYPFINRRGETQDGVRLTGFSAIPGLATDDALLTAIFTADLGFESDITPTNNDGLAVFRVTDIIEAMPQGLDDVRESATQGWKAEQVQSALVAKGAELAGRIRSGEDIGSVAREIGVETEPLVMQRANPPQNISSMVTLGLLEGETGDVVRGPAQTPGQYEIAVLDSVSTETERISGDLLGTLRERMSEQITLDISRAYEQAILDEKTARVYDTQLRNVLGLDVAQE